MAAASDCALTRCVRRLAGPNVKTSDSPVPAQTTTHTGSLGRLVDLRALDNCFVDNRIV